MFSLPEFLRAPSPPPRPEWGLAQPDGMVTLTISGRICWPNRGGSLELDAPLMRSFVQHRLTTTTDWPGLHRPQHFQGFHLMDALMAAGWRGKDLTLTGVDGRRVNTTLDQIRQTNPLVATEMNGMPVHCTRYAPLWLVFPYDQAHDRIQRGRWTALSVWGLIGVTLN